MSNDLKLSPEATVTVTVLLNLIRLLGAELVAGEHRDQADRVVTAILAKANATPLPDDTSQEAALIGIAEARSLLLPVVARIKLQAERAHLLDAVTPTMSVN